MSPCDIGLHESTLFSHEVTLNSVEDNQIESEKLIEDTLFHDEYKVRILGQAIIFLVAIPLNSLVIYCVLGRKAERTRVNYLTGHLCLISLVYTLFSVPFDVIWHITGKHITIGIRKRSETVHVLSSLSE